jgi:fructose/tagatose bisphosphate aldolase
MKRSRTDHFAVGALDVDNHEILLAIVGAAQAKQPPVLVEVSHGEVGVIGRPDVRSVVDNYQAGTTSRPTSTSTTAPASTRRGQHRRGLSSSTSTTAHPGEYAIVELIEPVIQTVQDAVEERIDLFAAAGHARP